MDSEYLKKHVGKALSEGLAEVCLKRPIDPIEYLAFWLRKYVENHTYEEKVRMVHFCLTYNKLSMLTCVLLCKFTDTEYYRVL